MARKKIGFKDLRLEEHEDGRLLRYIREEECVSGEVGLLRTRLTAAEHEGWQEILLRAGTARTAIEVAASVIDLDRWLLSLDAGSVVDQIFRHRTLDPNRIRLTFSDQGSLEDAVRERHALVDQYLSEARVHADEAIVELARQYAKDEISSSVRLSSEAPQKRSHHLTVTVSAETVSLVAFYAKVLGVPEAKMIRFLLSQYSDRFGAPGVGGSFARLHRGRDIASFRKRLEILAKRVAKAG